MKNQELAKIFYEIADYLEMEGVAFKPYAYRKAADTLESLEEDIAEIYKNKGKKGFEGLPGIGKGITKAIEEYLKTGKIRIHQQLKKKTPINLGEMSAVEGMGVKKAQKLYQKLGIRNLKELEKAARAHKIAPLFGFGEKTEKNILEGIKFLKRSKGRFLLGDILPIAREVQSKLGELKEVEQVNFSGSLRRMKETIGDVDFLVISKNPVKVMDFFVSLPGVVKIWAKGNTKASVRMAAGFDMDIRVVPHKSFGSALQYFTGSKEHNIATRRIAISRGLKLNEYGLFRGKKLVAGQTEEGVYKALGMKWMEPELRENQGEIEAALENKLPKIIGYQNIQGNLHCHSDWSDGKQTIKEMAVAAKALGHEYLGISDHAKLPIANGLNEKRFIRQMGEIDKLNKKITGIKLLKGAEVNILENGSLDIKDEVLKKFDYVIAGVHSRFKMGKEQMTERIVKAMENPYVNIIAHLTGRKIGERDESQIDLDKILRAAKEYNVILEINAQPIRLDLKDVNIRKAKEAGVKMIINTDAHNKNHLKFMEFGIAQARRGWAEKKDIINCYHLKQLLKFLK